MIERKKLQITVLEIGINLHLQHLQIHLLKD